jgi:hypothetical protein
LKIMICSPNGDHRAWEIRHIGEQKAATVVGPQGCNAFVGASGPRMCEMPAQWNTHDMNHAKMRG